MAKSKAPTESPESIVSRVLEAIANTPEGELKLLGKDDPAPLLVSKTGPNKEVYDLFVAESLLEIRIEDKKEYAKLTSKGLNKVAAKLTPEILGPATTNVVCRLPLSDRVEFLNAIVRQNPSVSAELDVLLNETIAAEAMEQEARLAAKAKLVAQEEATRKGLLEWDRLLEIRRTARIEALKKELALDGQTFEKTIADSVMPIEKSQEPHDSIAQETTAA